VGPANNPVVESFASSGGKGMGIAGVGIAAVVAVWALLSDPTGTVSVVLFMVSLAAICWIVLVRPGVEARERSLLLKNMLRDTNVPWGRIESCESRQTLQVRTDDAETYHGLGLSRSTRSMVKAARPGGIFTGGTIDRVSASDVGGEVTVPRSSYPDYVSSRVMNLARDRRRTTAGAPVETTYSIPAVAVLVAGVAAFVAGTVAVIL
jgi:hypothetical protein